MYVCIAGVVGTRRDRVEQGWKTRACLGLACLCRVGGGGGGDTPWSVGCVGVCVVIVRRRKEREKCFCC